MRNVVIVDSVRTGLAKSFRGGFNQTRADNMTAHLVNALLERNPSLKPEMVEDMILGCGAPEGAQGHNIARNVAVLSNLPIEVGGTTVNRYCSSGLQTVAMAANQVASGFSDCIMAGGVESISTTQGQTNMHMYVNEQLAEDVPGIYHAMGQTAECVAKRYNVTREAQDEYALSSQQRTAAAQEAGFYDDEIIPMDTVMKLVNKETGEEKDVEVTVDRDDCNRPETTIEGLSSLKPVFDPENGSVTAGNSSQLSDGASVTLVMSEDKAKELGLTPLATVKAYASAGVDPAIMGTGPIPSTQKCLEKAGWTVGDLDLIEANEAFAAQALGVAKELQWDDSKVNVNGGAIALGHPIGASGARILATLIHAMESNGAKTGLATLCIGGGEASALIVERV